VLSGGVASTAEQEAYLRRYHAAWPGATTRAFAAGDCGDGRSTYDHVLDAALAPDLDPAAPGSVLDLGCGDGYLIERLRSRGGAARIVGLDLSEGELRAARARLGPAAALIQGRAQALPFADGAFAAIASHLAFTLMPDLAQIALELGRVLRPGGRFAALVGGGPPAGGAEAFAAFLDVVRADRELPSPPQLGDRASRDRDRWDALFAPARCEVVRFERLVVDLGGAVATVWAALSTMYGIAELEPAPAARLRAAVDVAWRPLVDSAGRLPCRMVVWLGVAVRR